MAAMTVDFDLWLDAGMDAVSSAGELELISGSLMLV
jgi:hypothetical protein